MSHSKHAITTTTPITPSSRPETAKSKNDNQDNTATPYTPFSPFFKKKSRKDKGKDSIQMMNMLSSTSSSPPISPNMISPYNYNHDNKPASASSPFSNHLYNTNGFPFSKIQSKTKIIFSPNGCQSSIQLVPESPQKIALLSPRRRQISDSTTLSPIFRNDVRQEWINAMFGLDFFHDNDGNDDDGTYITNNKNTKEGEESKYYTPPRQGIGLANIPSYLSYTATIPPPPPSSSPPSNNNKTNTEHKKVGLTLSRIPIGVYVRLVDIESEAFGAGIVPGSVLVEINGMGVLGEPSHKLLERLWQLEGHFEEFLERGENSDYEAQEEKEMDKSKNNSGGNNNNSSSSSSSSGGGGNNIFGLKFIKDGTMYNVILMSGTPMGISWAPCANFALVQRTYALAQKAGVRRGCIVAAVNDQSLRTMNHLDTAMYIKDQFEKRKMIRVVCVFTPAASRAGHFQRKSQSKLSQGRSGGISSGNDVRTFDGVRIRKVSMLKSVAGGATGDSNKKNEKPVEYGVGSFFTCGTGINYQPNSADTSLSDVDIVSGIANRVAAGELAAPTGFKGGSISTLSTSSRRRRGDRAHNDTLTFSKLISEYMPDTNSIQESPRKELVIKISSGGEGAFPKLPWFDIFPIWDGLEAIIFCLRMHAADYSEEKFYELGGIIGATQRNMSTAETKTSGANKEEKLSLHSKEANAKLISAFGSSQHGSPFQLYLLQLVAFISSRELFERTVVDRMAASYCAIELVSGSKKKELIEKVNWEAKKKVESIYEDIVQTLVAVAIRDDSFCQNLHFLLRSFSSTIVKKKVGDDDAIFSPIKMLTSAHCLLRNRLLDRDVNGIDYDPSFGSPSGTLDQSLLSSRDSIDAFNYDESKGDRKKKGKKFGKLFRRGSKKGASKDISESLEPIESDNATPNKNNSRPKPILRKAADQDPQSSFVRGNNSQISLDVVSTAVLFENMGWFLSNLDQLCGKVENALLKSFSKKITEWALQPWNANKDQALANGTADMRNGLSVINLLGRSRSKENNKKWSPVINPVNPNKYLMSVIPEESYILPSAHFPLLLTFNSCDRVVTGKSYPTNYHQVETIYRTRVKFNSVVGKKSSRNQDEKKATASYTVHATVGENMKETGGSTLDPYYESSTHRWHDNNILDFETRSSSGHPTTVMIRLSSVSFDSNGKENVLLSDENGINYYSTEMGFSYITLNDSMWKEGSSTKSSIEVDVFDYNTQSDFDQQGFLTSDLKVAPQKLMIQLEVITEASSCVETESFGKTGKKQTLLYKHDEDMRQELLATQFLDVCDRILKASGLDLKIKKYKCIPVGEKKGFIEWVANAFSLSELCKPMGSSVYDGKRNKITSSNDNENDHSSSEGDKVDMPFIRTGSWCQFESLRSLRHNVRTVSKHGIGLSGNNPVQDFLRSNAYDTNAPYLIQKEVMDNFVKSCAGYSVITYLLGVGDRHTDNLLLHPNGHFLHCDYSFILGQDPKTYLPMRITEHMVNGMGGRDSDNFAMFLSLAGASFVTLRRHPSVRILMSMVRSMVDVGIPDISINQTPDVALQKMHERFKLDLSDDEAVSFLEENIERSISSRIWVAVDAIHSLGKRF